MPEPEIRCGTCKHYRAFAANGGVAGVCIWGPKRPYWFCDYAPPPNVMEFDGQSGDCCPTWEAREEED